MKKTSTFNKNLCKINKKRCVYETQMPPIMANVKDGQWHKEKYLNTSRQILLQEKLKYNMKALALFVQKLLARLKFKRGGQNDRITSISGV